LRTDSQSHNHRTGNTENEIVPLAAGNEACMEVLACIVRTQAIANNTRITSIFFHNHDGEASQSKYVKSVFENTSCERPEWLNGNLEL
jgi:hypothetical protein